MFPRHLSRHSRNRYMAIHFTNSLIDMKAARSFLEVFFPALIL